MGAQAQAGNGGLGVGGALYNNGSASLTATTFTNNQANGGDGGNGSMGASSNGLGGPALGGAIFSEQGHSILFATAPVFAANTVTGGMGKGGAAPASNPDFANKNLPASFTFSAVPGDVRSSTTFNFDVTAFDVNNVLTTAFTGTVQITAPTKPSGGAISGTTSLHALDGIAHFTNISLDRGGAYILRATSGAITKDTANINVLANHLVYKTLPTSVRSGNTGNLNDFTVVLEGQDSTNQPANIKADVTLTKLSGPGTLIGTLAKLGQNGNSGHLQRPQPR